jgi:hypothetical protein
MTRRVSLVTFGQAKITVVLGLSFLPLILPKIMTLTDQARTLSELHNIYEAGNLRILAGAGVSIASGFPDWDTMNSRLLRNYLSESLRSVGVHQIDPGNSLGEA